MDQLNYAFFEVFKRLDKICGEIYQSQNGVTAYIEDMKSVPVSGYRDISDWENDLKRLQQYRHIRNRLAHEEGAFDINACTQKDIDWLQIFYERILNKSDPMAVLHQKKNQMADQPYIGNPEEKLIYAEEDGEMKTVFYAIIVIAVSLFLIVIAATWITMMVW